jgi:hypothetical protein
MRIGILSDTHIPERADALPQKLVDAFQSVDMIIHAGDLVDIKVIDTLKGLCKNVKAVRGNMDPPDARKRLPEKEIIQVGRFRIGVMHGYGAPDHLIPMLTEAFKGDSVDIIIFGHSHHPLIEKRGTTYFINPGSATDTIFAPYCSYALLEINKDINARIIKL